MQIKVAPYTNYFICGMVGRGKTTLAKLIIEKLRKYKTHAIFITDINNEYKGDFIIDSYEEFLNYYFDPENHFKLGKVYVLKFDTDLDDYEKVISIVHKELYNIYLILEESNILTTSSYIHKDLKDFVALHRHSQCNYLCVTRRPAEISRFLTAQISVYHSFAIAEPRDLQYLKTKGFDIEKLPDLEKPIYKDNKLIDLHFMTIDNS